MPKIDGQRVVADLKRLAEFGRYKTGVHRPTYSPVDVESRHWLADRFREAGLDTVIDGIGNVIGRKPGVQRRLLVGSHSETQPYGGWLDGSLGVVYGLELARAFADDPACGIEVAAWADEEGHYGNFLGSRSFTDARGAAARGFCREAAGAGRSVTLCRVSRSAYRAGRHARHNRIAHRRRRDDRRHLELSGRPDRRAEP